MLLDYLNVGGTELVNSNRLIGYLTTKGCPTSAVRNCSCETLQEALGHEPYTVENIADAPWYDPVLPESARFWGVGMISQSGLGATQRSIVSVDQLSDGQVFTSARKAGKSVKFTVQIFAEDLQALEYGRAWVSSVLDGSACGSDASPCELLTVGWFSECPTGNYAEDWLRSREMLDAVCVSGPLESEQQEFPQFWTQELEFTMASENPSTYSLAQFLSVIADGSGTIVTDFARNVAENPRGNATTVTPIGTNLVTNPSFETNINGNFTGVGARSRVSRPSWVPGVGAYCLLAQNPGTWTNPTSGIASLQYSHTVTPGMKLLVGVSYTMQEAAQKWQVWSQARWVFYNNSGGVVGIPFNFGDSVPANRQARTVHQSPMVVPAGATQLVLELSLRVPSGVGTISGTPRIYIDDLMIVQGGFVDDYPWNYTESGFHAVGGTTFNELEMVWSGTPNASTTSIRRRSPRSNEWRVDSGGFFGAENGSDYAIISAKAEAFPTWFELQLSNESITPGEEYFFGVEMLNFTGPHTQAQLGNFNGAVLRWLSASGTLISETTAPVIAEGNGFRVSGTGTAPAGAVRAALRVETKPLSLQGIPLRLRVGRWRINPVAPAAFFDGDSFDASGQYTYEWDGPQYLSSSTRTESNAAPVDPLLDPDCAPPPSPPRPPVIVDPCAANIPGWRRFRWVISGSVTAHLQMVPEIHISASTELDAARVYLSPVSDGDDPSEATVDDAVAFWEISYLPAGVTLVLDSLNSEATALLPSGDVVSADRLVLGREGQPLTWPKLSCGNAYVLFIDVPSNTSPTVTPLMTARREYQ